MAVDAHTGITERGSNLWVFKVARNAFKDKYPLRGLKHYVDLYLLLKMANSASWCRFRFMMKKQCKKHSQLFRLLWQEVTAWLSLAQSASSLVLRPRS